MYMQCFHNDKFKAISILYLTLYSKYLIGQYGIMCHSLISMLFQKLSEELCEYTQQIEAFSKQPYNF